MTISRFVLPAILLIGSSVAVAAQQSSEDRKLEAELSAWREKIDNVDRFACPIAANQTSDRKTMHRRTEWPPTPTVCRSRDHQRR